MIWKGRPQNAFSPPCCANDGFDAPEDIFVVSSRRALRAKLDGDARALEQSGVADLERALASKLAREKRMILDVTGRQRLGAVISDLLFQSEFECKALLTPEDELRRKAETFEASARQFEPERRRLSDLLSLDRRELLLDLEAQTDQVWNEAKAEAHRLIDEIDDSAHRNAGGARQDCRGARGIFREIAGRRGRALSATEWTPPRRATATGQAS